MKNWKNKELFKGKNLAAVKFNHELHIHALFKFV